MSDMAAPKTISIVEINGRIAELEEQRNAALVRCTKLAGEKAEAIDLVQILKAEVERLTALLNDRNGPADASISDEPNAPPAPAPAGATATAH